MTTKRRVVRMYLGLEHVWLRSAHTGLCYDRHGVPEWFLAVNWVLVYRWISLADAL